MNPLDLVPPTERFTTPDGVEIVYSDEGEGIPILLVMGISLHLVHWPASLCARLREAGMRVIRFDNRDSGASSKMDALGSPTLSGVMLGQAPYHLEAMAADGIALLNHLGLSQVHLCGISMGGMIAQVMSHRYQDRFLSLNLMMTTPGGVYLPRSQAMLTLLRRGSVNRDGLAERFVQGQHVLAGPGAPPLGGAEELRALGYLIWDRGGGLPQSRWFLRQFAAIFIAPHRGKMLSRLTIPTRIIHGDLDPLIPPRAGFHLARAIPDSTLHIIQGLGHVLPQWVRPQIASLIAEHALQHHETS